jgi:hypothetical protein
MCMAWFDHATFWMEARKLVTSGGIVSSKITMVCSLLFVYDFNFTESPRNSVFVMHFQVPLRRTMTLKQVAECIQTCANVRDVEELTFSHIHASSQKKSEKINVLAPGQKMDCRQIRLKDMRAKTRTPGEKDNFWEFFARDCPENFYSIEYALKST